MLRVSHKRITYEGITPPAYGTLAIFETKNREGIWLLPLNQVLDLGGGWEGGHQFACFQKCSMFFNTFCAFVPLKVIILLQV
jgi:hypothetical protein